MTGETEAAQLSHALKTKARSKGPGTGPCVLPTAMQAALPTPPRKLPIGPTLQGKAHCLSFLSIFILPVRRQICFPSARRP